MIVIRAGQRSYPPDAQCTSQWRPVPLASRLEHWLAGVGVVRLLIRGQEGRQTAEADDETHNI